MSSVGATRMLIISLCTLLTIINHINAWTLPPSCHPQNHPAQHPSQPPNHRPPHLTSYILADDENITTTDLPTPNPTIDPTKSPTYDPTRSPTTDPTASPTTDPTKSPTTDPTKSPTTDPTKEPTPEPTSPSRPPTPSPTDPYDIKCCEDINKKWYYHENDEDSTCTQLHKGASCDTNGVNRIDSINLEHCNLDGSIPNEIQLMDQLRYLRIGDNQITGSIPIYFNNYKRFELLQYFYIQNNDITGMIPPNIFQYKGLRYINFVNNKNLVLDISKLNMTDSPVFNSKPAINVNFSFTSPTIDNDTDPSFYTLFEKIRFNTFSMRASTNNFTFNYSNIDQRTNKHHKISAVNTFDLYGNNLTGEFPCFFEKWPNNLYVAENFITSSNVTCYLDGGNTFDNLMIFQQEAAYKTVDKCYANYGSWGYAYTDHYKYCMYANYEGSPPNMKGCCNFSPPPTPKPTQQQDPKTSDSSTIWFINHIEYFILVLILSFGFVIYFLWKRKKKLRRPASAEMQGVPRQPRKTTNGDKESLLYGDF